MNEPSFLAWHWEHFPAMTALDVVKLMFQAQCGCGHLLTDEASVLRRIEQEEATLSPAPDEPLTQPLGQEYVRLNLRSAMARGIQPCWIARMMILSAPEADGSQGRLQAYEALQALKPSLPSLSSQELDAYAQRLLHDPDWLPSHSAAYRTAYHPAYRVVSRRFVWLLDALAAFGSCTRTECLLVCIDGPCASGKSTMAEQLCAITDAALIHMDDFYTPHSQKTPQRLAQPAGNADIERFLTECLGPWLEHGTVAFRPYLCHKDAFGDLTEVPRKPITIIEGSYSLHPEIAAHADIKLWLSAPVQLRLERIRRRNGEAMLERFMQQWIPLEDAYASAFSLPDEGCFCLSGDDEQDVY